MIYVVIIFSIIGVVLFLYWFGGRLHQPVSIYQLSDSMEVLLNKGLDGSFIVITEIKTGLWVQIRKYFDSDGKKSIVISLPDAPWSKQYFEDFQELLSGESLPFVIDKEDPDKNMEFLYVDCGSDVEFANYIVAKLFINVFRISKDDKFMVKGTGIAVFGPDIEHVKKQPKKIRDLFK